jgi:hypothetical protein
MTQRLRIRLALAVSLSFGLVAAAAACDRSARGEGKQEVKLAELTVDEVAARLDSLAIFDANSQERYEQSHVPGAKHLDDYSKVQARDLPADHGTPLVFYCANEH